MASLVASSLMAGVPVHGSAGTTDADHPRTPAGSAGGAGSGPTPILRKGYRPFFLVAALFAGVILPLWMLVLGGSVTLTSGFTPVAWHAHEMIFGFTAAVIAGFLLTAVGNWTSRETIVGTPLALLAIVWLAGRLAMVGAPWLPRAVPAVVDSAFWAGLLVAVGRPLVLARQRRNFVMMAILGALFAANLATHLASLGVRSLAASGWELRGSLVGLDVIVLLMLVLTGRIVPMFTRNATGVSTIHNEPKFDLATALAMVLLTLVDVAADLLPLQAGRAVGIYAGLVGVLAAVRARSWGTRHTGRDPLLWILHLGYGWIVLGLVLRGASSFGLVPSSVATHALTAGAIGALTLGMMARVSLGHSGRPIRATRAMTIAFIAISVAALLRVLGPIVGGVDVQRWLIVASALWSGAFVAYAVTYARILTTPRADGKMG